MISYVGLDRFAGLCGSLKRLEFGKTAFNLHVVFTNMKVYLTNSTQLLSEFYVTITVSGP